MLFKYHVTTTSPFNQVGSGSGQNSIRYVWTDKETTKLPKMKYKWLDDMMTSEWKK